MTTRRSFLKTSSLTAAAGLGGVAEAVFANTTLPSAWDLSTEIVVAGSGPAGMGAAVTAIDNNAKVYPKQKAQNFMRTLGKYYSLIYDDMTSYGIYSGGPNEQAYLTQTLNGTNNNIHNFINHPSVYGVYNDSSKTWSDSHDGFAYDQFISTFADNRYNIKDYGKLIYDITRGLLYNVWGENGDTRVKQYLGMQ